MQLFTPDALDGKTIDEDHDAVGACRAVVDLDDVSECMDLGSCPATLLVDDTTLDGHLHVTDEKGLVVDGDLTVTGALTVDDMAHVYVRGTLSCRNLGTLGGTITASEIRVSGALYGDYESGWTYAKRATIGLWLQGSHAFEFDDEEADVTVDLETRPPDMDDCTDEVRAALSALGVEFVFQRPIRYWEGDDSAAVTEQEWLHALRNDAIALSAH